MTLLRTGIAFLARTPLALQFLLMIVVGLSSFAALQRWKLARMERALRAAQLAALNASARADTTRLLLGKAVQAFGGQLAVWQRLVVQERQEKDAIDRALGQERRLRGSLQLTVARLSDSLAGRGTVETPDGVRSDTFARRQPPYTVAAVATLPPPPARGTLALDIALDPARLQLRLGCTAGSDARALRSVAATVAGPPWLRVQLDSLTTTPELCNPPRPRPVSLGQRAKSAGLAIVVWEGAKALARALGIRF